MVNRLVLVEGLPGTGKSTTAHLLARRARANGFPATWFYEQVFPHPVPYLELKDLSSFFGARLELWRSLARRLAAGDEILFLESCLFQHTVLPLLTKDAAAQAEAHLQSLIKVLAGLRPSLIYLRFPKVVEGLRQTCHGRGPGWTEHFVRVTTGNPYSVRRNLEGLEGALEFTTRYRALCDGLLHNLDLPTLDVSVSDRRHVIEAASRFLGIDPAEPPLWTEEAQLPIGDYTSPRTGTRADVFKQGDELLIKSLWWPQLQAFPLLPAPRGRFEIQGSPIELALEPGREALRVVGEWQTLPGVSVSVGDVLERVAT